MNATDIFIKLFAAIQAKYGYKNRTEIANASGINYTYLSELATGKVSPTEKTSGKPTATIKKFCAAFNVNSGYILTGEGAMFLDEQPPSPTPQSPPDETNRFIDIINRQLDVISKRDEQIDRQLDIINKHSEQIDRLITIIEKQ